MRRARAAVDRDLGRFDRCCAHAGSSRTAAYSPFRAGAVHQRKILPTGSSKAERDRRLFGAQPSNIEAPISDTVLLGGLWRANTSELKPTIDTLRAIGVRRIIILGKVPIWGIGLPDLVAAYYRLKRKLLPDFSSLLLELRPDAELKSAAATLGVDFISIYDILCKNGECRTRIGDDVMAGDRDHFTPAGSKYVVGKMANDVLPEKQSTGEMSKPPTNAN